MKTRNLTEGNVAGSILMLAAMHLHPSVRSVAVSYPVSWALAVILMAFCARKSWQ